MIIYPNQQFGNRRGGISFSPIQSTWGPSSTAGLALWLESANNVYSGHNIPAQNGQAVSNWVDRSPAGYNFVPSVDTPIFNTGSPQPYISFSFTNLGDATGMPSVNQPSTSFVVFQSLGSVGTILNGGDFGRNSTIFIDGASGNVLGFYAGSTTIDSATSPTTLGWHVVTTVFSGSNSYMRLDRSQILTGNPGTGPYLNGITLGSDGNGGNYYGGNIAAALIYSGILSTNDISSAETYLRNKYGTV